MREMAIFGVPCWGLMVSGGVQGSNDRAGSYRGPTALVRACHPQHRQNLRSPRSRPLWQLELEQALFCGEHRFEVQLFSFWCHFKKVESVWNIGLCTMTPHSSCRTLKIKISDWVKSVRKDCEERLECHKWRSHSCQVTWKQVRWAEETKFTLLFRNFRTSCPTHYFSRVSFLATFIRRPYIFISV